MPASWLGSTLTNKLDCWLTAWYTGVFFFCVFCLLAFRNGFKVIYFLLPSLHFHYSALLLHSNSPLCSITSLLKSLNAARNGFASDTVCLFVSLGVTEPFAQSFMLNCTDSKHRLIINTHNIYTQDVYCTRLKETDGPLNVLYALLSRPDGHRWIQCP